MRTQKFIFALYNPINAKHKQRIKPISYIIVLTYLTRRAFAAMLIKPVQSRVIVAGSGAAETELTWNVAGPPTLPTPIPAALKST